MIEAHYYYFSKQTPPSWFTFESTKNVPAAFGSARWSKNGDMQLGHANAGRCAADKPDYVRCEAHLQASPCGPKSRRLPLMGTGLAFQHQCREFPFALYGWTGEPERTVPPTCAALRKRIAPSAESDLAPADCLDEGAVALQSPAAALQQRAGVSDEGGIKFSIAGAAPLPWDELLKNTISAAGSPWLDRSQPAAVITAHNMPCGHRLGRCTVPFTIRPGTTDSAVLGQVIARDEYQFLHTLRLPPPDTVLDAGGAPCGCTLFACLARAELPRLQPTAASRPCFSRTCSLRHSWCRWSPLLTTTWR